MNSKFKDAKHNLISIIKLSSNNIESVMDYEHLEIIKDLAILYETSNEKDKKEIRNIIEITDNPLLLSISERISEIALNNYDKDLLRAALILHSIEDFRFDPRENIIYLSIILYVAEKLLMDKRDLFNSIEKISTTKAAEYLNEFINRPPSLQNLGSMGLETAKKNGITIFIQKKYPWENKKSL
jgi:hypothetical protein